MKTVIASILLEMLDVCFLRHCLKQDIQRKNMNSIVKPHVRICDLCTIREISLNFQSSRCNERNSHQIEGKPLLGLIPIYPVHWDVLRYFVNICHFFQQDSKFWISFHFQSPCQCSPREIEQIS